MLGQKDCARFDSGGFNRNLQSSLASVKVRVARTLLLTLSALILSSCISSQPQNITNVCEIFAERRNWYQAAHDSEAALENSNRSEYGFHLSRI